MKIKNITSCVEFWLLAYGMSELFLDMYDSGSVFCDSGNTKRMRKLYPDATLTLKYYSQFFKK